MMIKYMFQLILNVSLLKPECLDIWSHLGAAKTSWKHRHGIDMVFSYKVDMLNVISHDSLKTMFDPDGCSFAGCKSACPGKLCHCLSRCSECIFMSFPLYCVYLCKNAEQKSLIILVWWKWEVGLSDKVRTCFNAEAWKLGKLDWIRHTTSMKAYRIICSYFFL